MYIYIFALIYTLIYIYTHTLEENHETIEENHGTIEENYGNMEENHGQK